VAPFREEGATHHCSGCIFNSPEGFCALIQDNCVWCYTACQREGWKVDKGEVK